MPVTEIGDPRLSALFGANDPRDTGVRPVVRLRRKGMGPLALGAIAIVLGVVLFMVLNARRTSNDQPIVHARPDSAASAWQAPPPLYVPPEPLAVPQTLPLQSGRALQRALLAPAAPGYLPRQRSVETVYVPQPVQQFGPPPPPPQPQARAAGGSPLVVDTSSAPAGTAAAAPAGSAFGGAPPVTRMRASAFANRSSTVPQGSLIPAVLETGFDSTQPGFARAIVSKDIRSFDGRNVLIPRGSRVTGEYRSDVAQGQKRAVIKWTRLVRPDGMTIAIDSPAVDTVGRGGVPAHANTHFMQRFGDALLQSTIGLGQAFGSRAVTGPVVVVPGSAAAAAGQAMTPRSYVPTLSVPPGKSISIFVAHDLEFSAAGTAR